MKTYEMRIWGRGFAVHYKAENVKEAIRAFMTDEMYNFADGEYRVEVRGRKGVFKVKLSKVVTRVVELEDDKPKMPATNPSLRYES